MSKSITAESNAENGASLAPSSGCAALTAYIVRKKREARRKWPSRMNGPTCRELASYHEGQYVALVKLKKRLARIMKAQHNDQALPQPADSECGRSK